MAALANDHNPPPLLLALHIASAASGTTLARIFSQMDEAAVPQIGTKVAQAPACVLQPIAANTASDLDVEDVGEAWEKDTAASAPSEAVEPMSIEPISISTAGAFHNDAIITINLPPPCEFVAEDSISHTDAHSVLQPHVL